MKYAFRSLPGLILVLLIFAESAVGSVIFKPGEKARYQAPGEEEVSGSAREMMDKAQAMEQGGNLKGAVKAYRSLVRRHPHDKLAPDALYRSAQLQEQTHDLAKAAQAYAVLAEKFPKSNYFEQAIEGLFRIGDIFLAGHKVRLLGIPFKSSMDQAAKIFESIIHVAPYGTYSARAYFNLGRAREKEGSNEAALVAYQNVVEKFPNDKLAIDAQYQIGYIWSKATQSGTYDPNAANKAKTGFQDFLYRYPHSEKAAQARDNLKKVEHQQTSSSYQIAKFYDKQKAYKAAAIYYNDVIRQQPESEEGDKAKKRISELKAKLGEAALQPPAVTAAAANKKNIKPMMPRNLTPPPDGGSRPEPPPLPSADIDLSLPPPASLSPDNTTAPPTSTDLPASDTSAAPEATTPPPEQ